MACRKITRNPSIGFAGPPSKDGVVLSLDWVKVIIMGVGYRNAMNKLFTGTAKPLPKSVLMHRLI